MSLLAKVVAFAVLIEATILQSRAIETNGLFYVSSGEKADIEILRAHVFSTDNGNTDFEVILETSGYETDPTTSKLVTPVIFRMDRREYPCTGWVGQKQDIGNPLRFEVHGQDEAETIAKWLSTTCDLRSPPGYKLYAQFVPSKAQFNTNEPVMVKFQLKNMDERTVIFLRGGQYRGSRDNQYGFRAMFQYIQPVADTGSPINFGGLIGPDSLDPGTTFEDQIDLKKWFALNKPGTYKIHGFYQLAFCRPPLTPETTKPWGEIMWSDYASADFEIVVK